MKTLFIIITLISTSLQAQLYTLNSDLLKGASVSFNIYDLDKNETIQNYNPNLLLAPASTQKIITTAIGLDELGKDYQFYSELSIEGNIVDGTLIGNLIFNPNKNPALCNTRFGYSIVDLVQLVREFLEVNNVKKVDGDFILFDELLNTQTLPRTWIWEDIGNYFGANPSGTMVNENRLELYFNSGKADQLTTITRTQPKLNNIKINNQVFAYNGNSDLAYAFSAPNSTEINVVGKIPKNRKEFKVVAALTQPQELLIDYLKRNLKEFNFRRFLSFSQYNYEPSNLKRTKIHMVSLEKVVHFTNQNSVNILAESIRMALNKDLNEILSQTISTEVKAKLYDGSGLSRFNRITTSHLIKILALQQNNDAFINSLSVAGENGTLKNMFINNEVKGKIIAKSGYMDGVRSYAGYVNTLKGNRIAFAIIVNNYSAQHYEIKQELKKWMESIYISF